MKKVLAFLAALTLAVTVTACGDKIRQENRSDTSSDTNSDVQPANSPDQTGSDSSDNENSEPEPEPLAWHRSDEEGFKEMIGIFEMDDIEAPGEKLKKADADYLYGSKDRVVCVGYDFSYLRKVKPYFRNTIDDPGMINWDTLEIVDDKESEPVPDSEFFKIKAGDVLENGLKVKTAKTAFGFAGDGLLNELDIQFDGELTLEGIIEECTHNDWAYIGMGDLFFYPDSTKHSDIFTPYEEYGVYPWTFADPDDRFAMVHDGKEFYLGNIENASSSVSDLFKEDSHIKVRITLTDIHYKQSSINVWGYAEVKSVEKLG